MKKGRQQIYQKNIKVEPREPQHFRTHQVFGPINGDRAITRSLKKTEIERRKKNV